MLTGYHRLFNRFGLHEVDRGVDIPDPQLAIGFAENLRPTPLLVRFEPVMKGPQVPRLKTLEQASIDGQGRAVTMRDFPLTGYIGEQLGGF